MISLPDGDVSESESTPFTTVPSELKLTVIIQRHYCEQSRGDHKSLWLSGQLLIPQRSWTSSLPGGRDTRSATANLLYKTASQSAVLAEDGV